MDAIYSTLRAVLTSKVMLLAVGGALGTNARYWLALWLNEASWRNHGTWLGSFPLGTFVINVSGSFVLGLVGTIFLERLPDHREWFLLLGNRLLRRLHHVLDLRMGDPAVAPRPAVGPWRRRTSLAASSSGSSGSCSARLWAT